MAKYHLELSEQSADFLEKMAKRELRLYQRLASALDRLEENPFQGKPLKGKLKGKNSYRVGTYRIIYQVEQKILYVYVIDIGHRRDIY